MILELDCGNSLIKWRVLEGAELRVIRSGVDESGQGLVSALAADASLVLTRCRMVSVRSDSETAALADQLRAAFGIAAQVARSSAQVGAVRNGYQDPSRLGVDRWLAVLGAYQLSGCASLVLDLGTAVTADYVRADGEHLGGFICPGLPLMRDQLGAHTRRIRYVYESPVLGEALHVPGRITADAVERGCLQMLQGFVLAQVEQARVQLGNDVRVYLTGGDAGLVSHLLPEAHVVPDLVFVGLAIACPLA